MSRCKQCHVIIRDEGQVCPLCKCVLELDDQTENKYPDIGAKNYIIKLITRIYLFLAILIETAMIVANYIWFNGIWWCVIVGVALAYIYLTLAYTVSYSRAGYRMKIVVGVAGGIGLLVVIDRVLGNLHWSTNYAFPALLIAVDVTILLLMLINRRNWQSYMVFQLLMIVFSVIPVILSATGQVTEPTLAYTALGISVFSFLGTYIIGGKRALAELYRRFHI